MKRIWLWGPVALHMAFIFVASSAANPDQLPGRFLDKVAHLAVYALLGALMARAVAGGRLPAIDTCHVLIAVALSTLYGVSDEWHQSFVPGRTPDAMDLVADALGAFVGALLVLLAGRFIATRQPGGAPSVTPPEP